MQLTINQPFVWLSATTFKPFLLIGITGISLVALYTPISSQTKELREKITKSKIPLSPINYY